MTELTPTAKRLLAQLRDLDDPTAEQRASGKAAVRDMMEAHGLRELLPAEVSPSKQLAAPGGMGVKLGWGLGTVLVVALGLYATQTWRTPEHAQPVAASAPSPAPAVTEAAAAPELDVAAPIVAADGSSAPARLSVTAAAGSSAHARRGAAKPTPSSLSEELKFLASVDAQLRSGGYDHVLQRLAQHKGSPALAEERAALRVLALCGRDNDAAAARARDQFLQGAPSSLLAARVRSACATGSRP